MTEMWPISVKRSKPVWICACDVHAEVKTKICHDKADLVSLVCQISVSSPSEYLNHILLKIIAC